MQRNKLRLRTAIKILHYELSYRKFWQNHKLLNGEFLAKNNREIQEIENALRILKNEFQIKRLDKKIADLWQEDTIFDIGRTPFGE